MNPNPYERTKDERFRLKGLAAQVCARGRLPRFERQVITWVADAQTMMRGVCTQSLPTAAKTCGYSIRSLQYGLHGRPCSHHKGRCACTRKRKCKCDDFKRNDTCDCRWEYVGVLDRGIVFLAGGFKDGGLAAGGGGLTPEYAINCDVLLNFLPSGVTSPDPRGAQKGAHTEKERGARVQASISYSPDGSAPFSDRKTAVASVSDTQIFPAGNSAPDDGSAPDSNATHSSAVSSKKASQTQPATQVTRKRVLSPASASDEQQGGGRLQTGLSRIAKLKLRNRRRIPKNLTGKFELLAIAYGVTAVSKDFGKWCDEDPAAKKKMPYPIHEYVKVVDSRLSSVPAEDPRITEGVAELSALSYSLTETLTTKKQKTQIKNALKEYPLARIKDALTHYVTHLPEAVTARDLHSFWTVSNIDAVLRAMHRLQDATEGSEDFRKAQPMQQDLQALKRQVGTLPFSQRLRLDDKDYSACPFHQGDGDTSFHVERKDDGVGIGTCFSSCARSFDAIAFVEKFDKVSTGESIRKLVSLVGDIENGSASAGLPPKPKASPMTTAVWAKSGRPVTEADAATLAASRPNSKTPSAATLNTMGFKMGSWGNLVAPYRLGDTFYTIKGRNITVKKFTQENAISQKGLFNIDAVTEGCDVYVVESELDAAVLHEHGFIAVSVINAQQRQIEPEVLKKLLTAERIFLVGDQDQNGVGQSCMNNLARLLPAEKVCRLSLPDGVKDVGEWAISAQFQEQFESAICTTPTLVGEKS
jgi:hypothetical protein